MSRFLLITTDPALRHRIEVAVAGGLPGDVETIIDPELPETPDELLANVPELPEAIIFGPGLAREQLLALVSVFDVQLPEVSLILVSDDDPEQALMAMRAGIRDVLPLDADAQVICMTLERACNASASRRRLLGPQQPVPDEPRGRVITVASPKGGIGKTTLAANMAVGLARIAPMSTVIVDLDTQFGDVGNVLRVDPEHTLVDAVTGAAAEDNMVLKAFLSVHPTSIYVLCAPHAPHQGDEISAAQITHMLRQLASEFSFVVVDTAPGLGEHALAAIEESTDIVLVSGMDVPSVRGLRKEMDILKQLDIMPETRHVVVNMADKHSGLSIQDIEATTGVPVDILVPRSRAVIYATNKGEPLLEDKKTRDPAAKGIQRLIKRFGPAGVGIRRKVHQKIAVRK